MVARKTLQKDYQETLENDLSCAICQDIYINPFMLNCSHSFCKFCVYRWLSKQTGCPQCRMTVTFQGENLALRNIINKMVQKTSEDFQKTRTTNVNQRLEEEEAQEKDGTMNFLNKAVSSRPRTSRYRYYRNISQQLPSGPPSRSMRAMRTIFPRDSPAAETIELSSGPDSGDSENSFTFGTLAQFFGMHDGDDELNMDMDESENESDFNQEDSDADDDDQEDDDDVDEEEDEDNVDNESDDDEDEDDDASDINMSEESVLDNDENVDADVDSDADNDDDDTDEDDSINEDDDNVDDQGGVDDTSSSDSEWSNESSDSDSSQNWSTSNDGGDRLSLNNIVFGNYSDDAENGNETDVESNSWIGGVRGQLSPHDRLAEIIPRDRYSDESTIEYATSTEVSLSSDESL